jgi:hypothetical protein
MWDARWRRDLVTVGLSGWFTLGLFLDAWAHNNVPRLETFFTPWHAVFYSGFTVTAGWLLWTVREQIAGRRWAELPPGYGLALVAVAGFVVAGVGDYAWHTAFGIEQNIDILFSPTHVGLIACMLAIVTTPVRAAAAERGPGHRLDQGVVRLLPVVVSLALATAQVLLFLQYGNALAYEPDLFRFALTNQDQEITARLMAAMVITTLVIVVPVLYLARHWTVPTGSVTAVVATCAVLSAAVSGFSNLLVAGGACAAAMAADLLVRWLHPGPHRRSATLTLATLVPGLIWAVVVLTAQLTGPPTPTPDLVIAAARSSLELSWGAPLIQAGIGLLAGILATSPPGYTANPPIEPDPPGADHRARAMAQPSGVGRETNPRPSP